jgi:hypothetical protein
MHDPHAPMHTTHFHLNVAARTAHAKSREEARCKSHANPSNNPAAMAIFLIREHAGPNRSCAIAREYGGAKRNPRGFYMHWGACDKRPHGVRAVQSSPFPPCAARRRGGTGGGWGTPGLAPGPRPPRPRVRKKVPRLCGRVCSKPKAYKLCAACGVSELPIMDIAVGGGRLSALWSSPALVVSTAAA